MQADSSPGAGPEALLCKPTTPKRRIICFDGDVTQGSVERLRDELLSHYGDDQQAEVTIMINSVGGSTLHAMGVHNFVREVLPTLKIRTVCTSTVGSAALAIFMLGKERLMSPHTTMVLHEISVPVEGREYSTSDLAWKVQQLSSIERSYASLVCSAEGAAIRPAELLTLMRERVVLQADMACQHGLATKVLSRAANRA